MKTSILAGLKQSFRALNQTLRGRPRNLFYIMTLYTVFQDILYGPFYDIFTVKAAGQ